MLLSNLNIFSEDCKFHKGTIKIDDEIFSEVAFGEINLHEEQSHVDCEGLYALPGFIDIHFHGAMNCDFCDATEKSIQVIADYEAKHGILAICPATMTYPEDRLLPVMKAAADHHNSSGADLVGINMEGPFISPDKVGAQNPQFVQAPNYEMLKRLDAASGDLVRLVDVAPEVEGCLEFVSQASKEYRISIAHTCATYKDAVKAFNSGAAHMTHLFNAMPPISHRSPGPIAACLDVVEGNIEGDSHNLHVEIITDGHHVDDAAIRLAFRLFGEEKMVIISDSCEATGMPEGTYNLGGQEIVNQNGVAVLAHDKKTIAASISNQYDCFKYAVQCAGIPLETAIAACTINPAKAITVQNNYGSITAGKIANLLLVDKDLNLIKIFRHGKEI